MILAVVLLLLAAGLLVAGAELFVENAAAAAGRLGVTVLAVAVLLAGAEPEELLTALLASAQDRPGLAVGDAIGANVTMLTGALGLAALVRPLPVGHRTRLYAAGAALAGVLAVLALLGGVTRLDGVLLVLAYLGLVAWVWRREQAPPVIGELVEIAEELEQGAPGRCPVVALVLVAVGLVVMTGGGALAVDGAARLVSVLDRTDTAVGLTVLGLAITATLGAAAVVASLPSAGVLPSALLAAALPVAVLVLARGGTLGRGAGAALVATYLVFTVAVLV